MVYPQPSSVVNVVLLSLLELADYPMGKCNFGARLNTAPTHRSLPRFTMAYKRQAGVLLPPLLSTMLLSPMSYQEQAQQCGLLDDVTEGTPGSGTAASTDPSSMYLPQMLDPSLYPIPTFSPHLLPFLLLPWEDFAFHDPMDAVNEALISEEFQRTSPQGMPWCAHIAL